MSQRNIDFGSFPDDPSADAIRSAFQKTQENFAELFAGLEDQAVLSVNRTPGAGITVNAPTGNVVVTANIACVQVSTSTLSIGISANGSNSAILTSTNQVLVIDLPNTISNIANVTISGNLLANNVSANSNVTTQNLVVNANASANNLSILNSITGNSINVYDASVSNLLTVTGGFQPIGDVVSSLVPANTTINVGSASKYYGNGYFVNLNSNGNSNSFNSTVSNLLSVTGGFQPIGNVVSDILPANTTIDIGNSLSYFGHGYFSNISITGNVLANNLNANTLVATANLQATANVLTNNLNVNSNTLTNNLTVNLSFNGNTANLSGNLVVSNIINNNIIITNQLTLNGNPVMGIGYVMPTIGTEYLASNINITGTTSSNATTILTFNIPNDGIWQIDSQLLSLPSLSPSGSNLSYGIYYANGTIVANSEILAITSDPFGPTTIITSSSKTRLTTTGPETLTVRGWAQGAAAQILNYGSNGRTSVSWERLDPIATISTAANVTFLNANITGNLIGGNISGNIIGNFTGTLANGTSNVSIPTINGNVNLSVAGISNVLSATVTGINVIGNVAANNANLGNLVSANFYTGTLTTNNQPNITSVGTLTSLLSSGNIQSNNIIITNSIEGRTSGISVTAVGINQSITLVPTGTGNVNVSGFTIVNLDDPVNATDATNKQYVDAVAQGLSIKASCNLATTTTLATISGGIVTYNNGVSGVGATLTTTGSYSTIDSVAVTLGMRILVKDEVSSADNGIYVVTNSTTLTRATDFDTSAEMVAGVFTFISQGSTYSSTGWVSTSSVATVGTDPINWSQFSGAGTYTAGTGLSLVGSQFKIANTAINPATYGNGDYVGQFTVNQQGQLTGASNVAIAANAANLTGTTLASGVVTSSLTSLGTLGTLSVTGNISSGNANLGNLATANYYSGDGGLLSNISAGSAQFIANGTSNVSIPSSSGNVNISVGGVPDVVVVSSTAITAPYYINSVQSGIAGAGTTQGAATQLGNTINVITSLSAGANSVKLPSAVSGLTLYITNTTNNNLNVFPFSGDRINVLAIDASFTHAANATLHYIATSTSQWYTVGATYA